MSSIGEIFNVSSGPSESGGLLWWNIGEGWIAEEVGGDKIIEETRLMPDDPFAKSVSFSLRYEGDYTVNEQDPGNWTGGQVGAGKLKGTRWGISSLAYPSIDIASLSIHQAIEIYRHDYWDASGASNLPYPLSLAHFDASVNCGIRRANAFLSSCNGDFARYNELRMEFYESIDRGRTFQAGWAKRVSDLGKLGSS
jgi:lysozyme family protein